MGSYFCSWGGDDYAVHVGAKEPQNVLSCHVESPRAQQCGLGKSVSLILQRSLTAHRLGASATAMSHALLSGRSIDEPHPRCSLRHALPTIVRPVALPLERDRRPGI